MIAIIHRGQKFKETMEAFQQKRAEFIAQEIRNFDTETLYVFLEWIRGNGHKLDILHDIRKVHENDMESAPDTTPADELIKEVRKAMQSTGDRVQEFLEIFCKAFQLKYKRLTDEERTTLKRLFKRSPLIKNSGINFRRRPWK